MAVITNKGIACNVVVWESGIVLGEPLTEKERQMTPLFTMHSVQKCDQCGTVSYDLHNEVVKYCRRCKGNVGHVCYHRALDVQGDCPDCGLLAEHFAFGRERLTSAFLCKDTFMRSF